MPEHVWAPGRVNLIGEHIDYHGLPVLPMALRQRINVAFERRGDSLIRAESKWRGPTAGGEAREFEWRNDLTPVTAGDWENYLRAAARAVSRQMGYRPGMDAAIVSDLPPAAGLSSSSALMVAFTLACCAPTAGADFRRIDGRSARRRAIRGHPRRRHGSRGFLGVTGGLRCR